MALLSGIWNWISGKQDIPELPSNILFEKDVTSDNDFWISCILDPTLEIKYVNGIVTRLLDTDKCLIDEKYHYQPKTDKEIRNFPYIEVKSPVRISLYRKKNSNEEWKVASCFLSKEGPHTQATRFGAHKSVFVESEEPTSTFTNKDNSDDNKADESLITIEVIGDIPKIIGFEQVSTVQILFRNNSYAEKRKVLDYRTEPGNKTQLSIISKPKLPVTLDIQSQYTFDINLEGKFLGRSTEKVEFVFEDIIYKIGINIEVVDSRVIVPTDTRSFKRHQVDMQKLLEMKNEYFVPGIRPGKRAQFSRVKIGQWTISNQLNKCYWTNEGKYNFNINEVKDKISNLYPAAFESLCYSNYKAKFHTLLFMEEIEITIALQKYSQERIHFEHCGEFLSLTIPNLSEQRPSLISGDFAAVTDPPNCTKLLDGNNGRYEGLIHKVTADTIMLKFDPEFHSICGNYDFSVTFFHSRTIYRKQHEIINEVWRKSSLGEAFLFPYKESMEYQPPKIIMENNKKEQQENGQWNENLNSENKLLPKPKVICEIRWFNKKLNSEQKCAVMNILKGEGRPMPYVIFGPPGTGKTITLTESIIQVYKELSRSKLLVCAPTNSAADLLLIKLVETGLFDETIMKRLIGYNYFMTSNYTEEIDKYCYLPDMENACNNTCSPDVKTINKNDILKLKVVITTAGSAGMLYMMGIRSGTFTHIFVDEAGQMTEPEILLPLSFLDPFRDGQVVLAGDPKQLGPVVMSTLAKNSGLGQSMLARFIHYPSYSRDPDLFPDNNGYNPRVITHLIRNYRSLPEIVDVYNKMFYDSLLVATKLDDNVPERIMVNNLNENAHWGINCKGPVIVHGIKGEDFQEPSSPSWFNPHEAFQVLLYTTRLLKAGISAADIGIISPYCAQVCKINELLKMYHPDIELPKVGTVEMFQGQERMVIIISIVRSTSKAGIEKDKKFSLGFFGSKERVNVSLSRAKGLLIVIGNPSNMLSNTFWKKILNQAIANQNYVGCNISEWSENDIIKVPNKEYNLNN
ncbi:probable RNA helicase armi [Adelges cooleyi]|uniref:probable RNA helicase armi n=1 Tax=Adelges cooleyi TaxID=133065 RepID=UPI00217F2DFE|nr:probable RNA helicase armi [Adelges cooleyi]